MSTTCRPCKAPKRKNDVVCPACWARTPKALRDAFRLASAYEDRVAAVRAVLDHHDGTPSLL